MAANPKHINLTRLSNRPVSFLRSRSHGILLSPSHVSFLCAQQERKNQLIVGPQTRASKVLRETYGERFMADHGMRIFVESIVFAVLPQRNKKWSRQSSDLKINVLYLFFLEALRKIKFFFDELCCIKWLHFRIRPNKNQKEVAKKIFLHIMPVPCLFIEVNALANRVVELSRLN